MTKHIDIALSSILCASLGSSAAHAAESFRGQTFFFGDLHAHTGVSDDAWAADGGLEDDEVHEHWESVSSDCPEALGGCGTMEAVFDTAIDNGLDFVALTDHHDSDPEDFDWLLALSLQRTDLLVIPSAELRYQTPNVAQYGHKNIYVFHDGDLTGLGLADLIANPSVREGHCREDIWTNVADLSATFGPSLLWAHHPSASEVQTTDWSCHDEDYEPVVEIYSGWGNALTLDAPFDPVVDSGEDRTTDDWEAADSTVEEALEMGYRLGFVGGTDRHDTRPGDMCDGGVPTSAHPYAGGLTMVALEGDDAVLTRSAIHDTLVNRRTFVTSGPQVPVHVEWTLARGGAPHGIGEVIDVATRGHTTLRVRVPPAYEGMVTSVRAIGYDTISYPLTESTMAGSWSVAIANATIPSWLYVEVAIDGAMYYPDGCDDGGTDENEFIWSSPTWFE
jgi:hypothetical protein